MIYTHDSIPQQHIAKEYYVHHNNVLFSMPTKLLDFLRQFLVQLYFFVPSCIISSFTSLFI